MDLIETLKEVTRLLEEESWDDALAELDHIAASIPDDGAMQKFVGQAVPAGRGR
jgi:hypothetical protein